MAAKRIARVRTLEHERDYYPSLEREPMPASARASCWQPTLTKEVLEEFREAKWKKTVR